MDSLACLVSMRLLRFVESISVRILDRLAIYPWRSASKVAKSVRMICGENQAFNSASSRANAPFCPGSNRVLVSIPFSCGVIPNPLCRDASFVSRETVKLYSGRSVNGLWVFHVHHLSGEDHVKISLHPKRPIMPRSMGWISLLLYCIPHFQSFAR